MQALMTHHDNPRESIGKMSGLQSIGNCEEMANSTTERVPKVPYGILIGDCVSKRLRRSVLTIPQVVGWAKAHREATGRWPSHGSGSVIGVANEHWSAINKALRQGNRGLPGGMTLSRLLAEHRDPTQPRWMAPYSNERALRPHWRHVPRPNFTVRRILGYVDEFYRQTASWPAALTTCCKGLPFGASWSIIDRALRNGTRGLPGGSSLARLLQERRGVRNISLLPPLDIDEILAWADAYHARTGEWPTQDSGPVPKAPAPDETWRTIAIALNRGRRGLPAGSSLAKLLAEHRGIHTPLTFERILDWADAHRAATGKWPTRRSGCIAGEYNETWSNVAENLARGNRGMPAGWTLSRLLAQYRGAELVGRAKRWASVITASEE